MVQSTAQLLDEAARVGAVSLVSENRGREEMVIPQLSSRML